MKFRTSTAALTGGICIVIASAIATAGAQSKPPGPTTVCVQGGKQVTCEAFKSQASEGVPTQVTPQAPSKQLEALKPQSSEGAPTRTTPQAQVIKPVTSAIPPLAVAQAIIARDFDRPDCPTVKFADRARDGTIVALCDNGERFRIFGFRGNTLAMRCSAVKALGIEGC
jgi:hypothetical protein